MKKTFKDTSGTSFHHITITTTVNELTRVLGEPDYKGNDGEGKINFEWECERENGDVITIYDWKNYRSIGLDEVIEFHLGGRSAMTTFEGKLELRALLNKSLKIPREGMLGKIKLLFWNINRIFRYIN
jgi:hypothetical protein